MFNKLKILLWSNRSTKQILIKNTFWLATAEILSRVLKIILIIYATRILGPNNFGQFSYALSFVGLFVVFSDFGLPIIFTREFSQSANKKKDFPAILTLKLLLGITTLIVLLFANLVANQNPVVIKAVILLALFSFANSVLEIFYAFFRAREKMQYEAVIKATGSFFTTILGFVLLYKIKSVNALAFSYGFVAMALLIATIFLALDRGINLRPTIDKIVWKKYLRQSWWLGFILVFSVIYNQIDLVMLGQLGKIKQAGWYSVSYKMIQLSLVPVGIIARSFFPTMNHILNSREKFIKIIRLRTRLSLTYAMLSTSALLLFSPWIIRGLFGGEFIPSVLALQILSLSLIGFSLNAILSNILVISNKQHYVFWTTLTGAVINVALNFVLIPRYSLYGASVATVVTIYTMFIALAILVKKNRLIS